jgi:predicted secreted hydrolase
LKNIVSRYEDKDDAVHPYDAADYYEWWYLDAMFDNGYSCALSCFWRTEYQGLHIPLIIVDIYPPEGKRIRGAAGFDYKDCSASLDKCDVAWGGNHIRQEGDTYSVSLRAEDTGVDLVYKRSLPGWKWTRDGLMKNDADGIQGWVNPVPRADVTGNLFLGHQTIPVRGQGYHDHNWGNVEMSRSFAGWGWGRMYDPKYTFVYGWFMPLQKDAPLIPSLYVARGHETVFASPYVKCTLGREAIHTESGDSIPNEIRLKGRSDDVEINCRLDVIKVIEFMKTGPDRGGFTTNYYRRLNKYNASIIVDGLTEDVSGQALNEYVLLRHPG